MQDNKILLFIKKFWLLLIILLLVIFGLIYFFYIKSPKNSFNNQPTNGSSATNPEINIQDNNISKILNGKSFYPCINKNEKYLVYINESKNGARKLNFSDSKVSNLSIQPPSNIQSIVYSPDCKQMIVFSTNKTQKITYYNLENGNSNRLNDNITNIYWSKKDNNKIYYVFHDESNQNKWQINHSKPDGSNWKNLYNIKDENGFFSNLSLSNNEDKLILTTIKESGDYTIEVFNFLIDLNNVINQQKIDINYSSDNLLWTKDDKKIIYPDGISKLASIFDIDNKSIKETGLYVEVDSIIESINNTQLILAIPENINPSYPEIFNLYPYDMEKDVIAKINAVPDVKIINLDYLKFIDNTVYYTNNDYLYSFPLGNETINNIITNNIDPQG
ncbi:MAG: hypothetical protein ACD_58C00316G0009 [uncultured bacterium]|nr:MAG: hypothetical protein ACD_58C00316G0009 [uncultured bacterium]